ncbi:S-layer homology domain-containing protein [Halonatronum saccharophilum]|uniref:S-layer homology domain-containing protein n=1 Tax=Halonatronum saccharophilum TaxID=150060 RepID=UPI000484711D|nr:S-layer homology domain-containing protein [Halonatronum saccharophilum]
MPKRILTTFLTVFMILALALPAMAYRPQDVATNHWALRYISPLLDDSVMYVYEDGNFYPSQEITRGEFAYSLARALELQPSMISEMSDISNHHARGYISVLVQEGIITGYEDNTFRPYNKITRAEIITMLGRSLSLDDREKGMKLNENYYSDLNQDHWAANLISLSSRLGLVDGYPDGTFKPNNHITRAESAKLLEELRNLTIIEGEINETYPISRMLRVNANGRSENFRVNSNSLIGRNNRFVNLDEMLISDKAYMILNDSNEVIYLKSYGLVTQEDIAQEASDLTNNILGADELISIVEGDWESVTPRIEQEVITSLIDQGLTMNEIQALMDRDWEHLEESGRERLIETISMVTDMPKDLIVAIYNRDWDAARDVAQNTAITRLLTEVMLSSSWLS